ncbi:hypothetical protein THOG05_330028 [Vibrio rotiferianus]|nr:hypothetical protein THOG05_330028 [Vibrio rotiferianus]
MTIINKTPSHFKNNSFKIITLKHGTFLSLHISQTNERANYEKDITTTWVSNSERLCTSGAI